MNSYAKLALAFGATVVVTLAGCQRPGAGTPGAQPAATPSPPASPTSSAAPSLSPLSAGSLAPGRYALDWSGPPTSLEVPAGWTGESASVMTGGEEAEVVWGGHDRPVTHVYVDACQTRSDLEPVDGTLQGLRDALDAQLSTDATITDVTFGGHAATQIELAPSPGVADAICQTDDPGLLQIWADPAETDFFALPQGARAVVHLLEIDGEVVVFAGAIGPDASPGDLAELEAIIASTRIDQ